MKKEKMNFCAPALDSYRWGHDLHRRTGLPEPYSPETMAALDELFNLVRGISPYNESNGLRRLYLPIEKGTLEDYKNYCVYFDDDDDISPEEIEEMWKRDYPDEKQWFSFDFIEDDENGFRGIFLDNRLVLETLPGPTPPYPEDASEFVQWLAVKVRECLPLIKSGEYNRIIREELSPDQRTGTITRKAYWEIFPEDKKEYFSDFSDADQKEFLSLMAGYDKDALPDNLLPEMTSGLFFRCCQMGYAANHYEGSDTLSPKELYRKYADMRDEGLLDIDENSPKAFAYWLKHRPGGGHPWEVCRGGNSTHVSLYVGKADTGFYFVVAGKSWGRSIETIKFFLALHHAGMPVKIRDGKGLADRISGKDKIGIVPKGVTPCYCESYFPNEEILDFMNLPDEKHDEFAKRCVWQDEPEIMLIHSEAQ